MVYTEVKKQKQKKANQGNNEETYWYCKSAYSKHSHTEQSINLNENISHVTMSSSKTCKILCPSMSTFKNILTNKRNPRVFIHFWYQNNIIKIYQNI